MSVGFRPTAADEEIIQAHKRPDESTSDVLRRALRALDHQKWEDQARRDMERIAASGEDLSEEPDDWGYDDQGRLVIYPGKPATSATTETESARANIRAINAAASEQYTVLRQALIDSDLRRLSSLHALAEPGRVSPLHGLLDHSRVSSRKLAQLRMTAARKAAKL